MKDKNLKAVDEVLNAQKEALASTSAGSPNAGSPKWIVKNQEMVYGDEYHLKRATQDPDATVWLLQRWLVDGDGKPPTREQLFLTPESEVLKYCHAIIAVVTDKAAAATRH